MVLLFVYMLLHLIPDCVNSGTSEDVLKCFELLRLFSPCSIFISFIFTPLLVSMDDEGLIKFD